MERQASSVRRTPTMYTILCTAWLATLLWHAAPSTACFRAGRLQINGNRRCQDECAFHLPIAVKSSAIGMRWELPTACPYFINYVECTDRCAQRNNDSAVMLSPSERTNIVLCTTYKDTYLANKACVDRIESWTDRTCDAKCGGIERSDRALNKYSTGSKNSSATADMMGELCAFYDCHLGCRKSMTFLKCSEEAAPIQLRQDVADDMFGYLDQVLSDKGYSYVEPSECNAFNF